MIKLLNILDRAARFFSAIPTLRDILQLLAIYTITIPMVLKQLDWTSSFRWFSYNG